jgi:hypothetical protein
MTSAFPKPGKSGLSIAQRIPATDGRCWHSTRRYCFRLRLHGNCRPAGGSMQATLDTLKAVHDDLGMSTLLGIGNAGFGMPDQTRLDMLYLGIAAAWGLDAALVDYHTEHLALYTQGIDFLTGRDPYGQGYLDYCRRTAGLRQRRAART